MATRIHPQQHPSPLRFSSAFLLTPLLISLLLISCQQSDDTPPAPDGVQPTVVEETMQPATGGTIHCDTTAGTTPQLDCPALPNPTATAQPDYDYFSWNTFIALNWPAVVPEDNSNLRGFPWLAQGKSFTDVAHDDLLVWETYTEKREIFFPLQTGQAPPNPGPWNKPVHYGAPPGSGSSPNTPDFPACSSLTGKQLTSGGSEPTATRLLGGSSKMYFDSLDETVEVLSEARESPTTLCKGYNSNPQCGTPDEDDCCKVAGQPVGPRVFNGSDAILYEVKVNYDFYNYVVSNDFYNTSVADQAAQSKGGIQLPYRTNASTTGGAADSQKSPPAVTDYSIDQCLSNYQAAQPGQNPGTGHTPCTTGAIHTKSAWLQLTDPSTYDDYHTTEALFYRFVDNQVCVDQSTFGLIGFHIIQRIHTGSGSTLNGQGGTFIFSTWEHIGNDSAGFTYSNYFPGPVGLPPPPASGFYPTLDNALPVKRQFSILPSTQQANQAVHQAIAERNPDSIWLNYQLVGTQFQAVNVTDKPSGTPKFPVTANDPTGIGQPLFLANLVVETNDGLQNFQGLPPVTPSVYSDVPANGILAFNRNTQNLSFEQSGYNMGGCMGCHGVAQIRGYSFSFVLLDGQRGADPDTLTPGHFEVPPLPNPNQ